MIDTHRLEIFPLTPADLELYLQAENKFEDAFALTYTGRIVAPEVLKMVTGFTLPNMRAATEDNYLFFTFWLVIEKASRTVVAELGFKGEPNARHEVEIGYGTMPGRQGEGFMSEAVGGMIGWARNRKDITAILAETDQQNLPSIKVLRKNGFAQFDKRDNMLWWKINIPQQQSPLAGD